MGAANHRHIALLLLILFTLPFIGIDANASKYTISDDSINHSYLLDSAEILKLKGHNNESIDLIRHIKLESENQEDWPNYVRSLIELVDVLRFTYYYSRDPEIMQEAYDLLDQAYSTIIDHLDTSHIIMSRFFIYKGKLIRDEGKTIPDTLEHYLQKASMILENNPKDFKEAAKLNYEFGTYYNNISQTNVAEKYFNQLVGEVNKFDKLDYFRAYYLYRANQFYYDIADLEKSMLCAQIALYIFNHPKHNDIANALDCENDIAAVYISSNILNTSTYQKALFHFKKIYDAVKPDFDDPISSYILSNMGLAFTELHLYDSAIRTFKKSIEINPSNTFDDSTLLASSILYLDLIDFIKMGNLENSVKLQKSMESYEKISGKKNYKTHVYHRIIGVEYEKKGNYNEALQYYQNGLVSLYMDFNSQNIYDNPEWEDKENIEPVLYILLDKARTLYARYKKSGNKVDLEAAFKIFQDGYNLMNNLLSTEMMSDSFIILFQNFKTDFQASVECALEAYEVFDDRKYLNGAFHFIEQSKYFLLLKSQQNALIMNKSGVDKELFLAERSLNGEIEQLKHQLNSEDSLSSGQAFEIRNFLLGKIVDKTSILNQINQALGAEKSESELQTLSLFQVQRDLLKENDLIIEYYWSRETIYALIVQSEKVEIVKIPVNQELMHQLKLYTQVLANKQSSRESFIQLTKSSYFLYQNLFKPIIEKSSIKSNDLSITIIADDALALLPFESFTTSEVDTTEINYWGLPYLCKEYVINYAYSLSILQRNVFDKPEAKNNKILAMSYSPIFEEQTNVEALRDENELPYSGLEITEISRTFDGADFKAYEKATEEQFKNVAQDYAIIHLAIHGEADTINRYNSKLLFRSSPEGTEDGQLHDYELYTLDLSKNQLAVLSACETGMGKQYEGEGIFSIARGFAFAGSPAIVMSLWKVNDKSTSMLMKNFYENLSQGMQKDKALQLAKISYIEKSDELSAHPSNWAAFIAMGNNRPIEMLSENSLLYFIFLSIGGILIVFTIMKYRNRP